MIAPFVVKFCALLALLAASWPLGDVGLLQRWLTPLKRAHSSMEGLGVAMPNHWSDRALAARATLLLMRAVAGQFGSRVQYSVSDATGSMSEPEAVEYLIGLPKPALCSARAMVGGGVTVDCRPYIGDELGHFRSIAGERMAAVLHATYEVSTEVSTSDATDGPLLMVTNGVESLVMNMASVQSWLRDYDFADYSVYVRPATAEAKQQGASAVMRVGPGPRPPSPSRPRNR